MRDGPGRGQVRLQVNITSYRYYYTYIVYVIYGYVYIVNNFIGIHEFEYVYRCDSERRAWQRISEAAGKCG